jgi:hypothetical protein
VIAVAFLPAATEACYDVMHKLLYKASGGRLQPKKMISDFEKGIGNSAHKTWGPIPVP